MASFDCLSLSCPLWGPHLLEASAGTGKTFAIEHIFLRLLLESDNRQISLDEILAVTFTRAATRELKSRIRKNLFKALEFLRGQGGCAFPYLQAHVGSSRAIQTLEQALAIFDRCPIYTIHGFCFKMLQEFAFEASLPFSLLEPADERAQWEESKQQVALFLERGAQEWASPEQLALLLKKYDSIDAMAKKLLRAKKKGGRPFSEQLSAYRSALGGRPTGGGDLKADFARVKDSYKAQVKGDFERQLEWLSRGFACPDDPLPFRKLIWDRGTLFSFLDPSNKKVRAKEGTGSDSLEWAVAHLGPIVSAASDLQVILGSLQAGWEKWQEARVDQARQISPDEILSQMQKAIGIDAFRSKVQKKFKAALIDEFQDTDPLQWDIFQSLFLDKDKPLEAFYLVGDPKQSIYRFRNADVYTYLAARERLGEANFYHLDTNFRSSHSLVSALNALFARNWLMLPEAGRTLPYLPVRAGSEGVEPLIADGKQSIHWIVGGEEASFEETFLPYAVQEIEALQPASHSSIALLVKDRYEAREALSLLGKRGIPAIARSHQALGKTEAFQAVRELLYAIASPSDSNLKRIVDFGPFASDALEDYNEMIQTRGLVFFASQFFSSRQIPWKADLNQILEELFAWEQREGRSLEGLLRFLDDFAQLEADEGGRQRMQEVENAVQVMTLHVSKGLEFEIVFALGLASCPPEGEEKEAAELDAEKLRQLYVAMTRAKKRLYLPAKPISSKPPFSPMDLFLKTIEKEEGAPLPYLRRLASLHSISTEEIPTPYPLSSNPLPPPASLPPTPLLSAPPFTPCYIHSFTSLASKHEREHVPLPVPEPSPLFTMETLPRGRETGVAIHQIFEHLFLSPASSWNDPLAIERLIAKELQFSSLAPWTHCIAEMVKTTLSLPLSDGHQSFCLKELKNDDLFVEMEFLYLQGDHFVRGFIDLVFVIRGKLYFLDWKTNWIQTPSEEALRQTMDAHDYGLQAALYSEALRRYLKPSSFEAQFGGGFYLFVRSGNYLHLQP